MRLEPDQGPNRGKTPLFGAAFFFGRRPTRGQNDRDMIVKPTFEIEDGIPGVIAGVDEAGRGPIAGPVVAAAS